MENKKNKWNICPKCLGLGRKFLKLRKSAKLRYQAAMDEFKKNQTEGVTSSRPKITQYLCESCKGSGLISASDCSEANTELLPHVSIIGAGIAGSALAVACLHRGIPFTLYERDSSIQARAQGYGLTLQQASNAIKGLGLFHLQDQCSSTRHVVLSTDGKEIVEWGRRTHLNTQKAPKRTNFHIPRQSLRSALLEQLSDPDHIKWSHRLLGFERNEDGKIEITFNVKGETWKTKTDLLIGADGIRSALRSLLIDQDVSPLRYLGYMVILGICSTNNLKHVESPLLDQSTVFQTVSGSERIYVMPYSPTAVMWQLSFPLTEEEAKTLSAKGALALKEESLRRASWHKPVPEILLATSKELISGYPVYDREPLQTLALKDAGPITLIGDAAHPMSPFKGQGANQALLDALALARKIFTACTTEPQWKEIGLREIVLNAFEEEMLERSSCKVKDSAKAAKLLHSKGVLREGDAPKDRIIPDII